MFLFERNISICYHIIYILFRGYTYHKTSMAEVNESVLFTDEGESRWPVADGATRRHACDTVLRSNVWEGPYGRSSNILSSVWRHRFIERWVSISILRLPLDYNTVSHLLILWRRKLVCVCLLLHDAATTEITDQRSNFILTSFRIRFRIHTYYILFELGKIRGFRGWTGNSVAS